MEENADNYINPINYKSPGRWKGVSIANAVEGIAMASIVDMMLARIPFTFQFKLVILIITFVGIVIMFTRGINGERVSLFLVSSIKYLFFLISKRCKYQFRKVGIKDVEASSNRSSGQGTGENNFKKMLSFFNQRKEA